MKTQLTTGHRPEVSKTTDLIGTSRSCCTTLFAHRNETASNHGSNRGELSHIPSAITKSNRETQNGRHDTINKMRSSFSLDFGDCLIFLSSSVLYLAFHAVIRTLRQSATT
jgi:hypothetical protein